MLQLPINYFTFTEKKIVIVLLRSLRSNNCNRITWCDATVSNVIVFVIVIIVTDFTP